MKSSEELFLKICFWIAIFKKYFLRDEVSLNKALTESKFRNMGACVYVYKYSKNMFYILCTLSCVDYVDLYFLII